jgi:hypothetical protein
MTPRWDVELVDHDAVTTVEEEGTKFELELQYSIKVTASNERVAERIARNLLTVRHPESAGHNVTATTRQIHSADPSKTLGGGS